MSNKVERNFAGFVKAVIGATGLVAMGAVVAGGLLLKGFKEETKTAKESSQKQEPDTEKNTVTDSVESVAVEIIAEAEVAT